ncbi:uncharacterized protein B0T15DRAFT_518665 [Chaetomium strumarium]|uniref:Secreted protein n=1 Tax=Chaetomium strumarium TaxID=1170767 RepID=A0AAJ0H2E8_9PEZI|nr:hypothetical protein B0T15DRAFT_518665 [Chaetomium strumarium]
MKGRCSMSSVLVFLISAGLHCPHYQEPGADMPLPRSFSLFRLQIGLPDWFLIVTPTSSSISVTGQPFASTRRSVGHPRLPTYLRSFRYGIEKSEL